MLIPAIRAIAAYRAVTPREKTRHFTRKPLKIIWKSTLALLVALVRADDVNDAPAAHDLAVLADLLDRRTYFHNYPPGILMRCAQTFLRVPSDPRNVAALRADPEPIR
jgi:hypothetical protein